MNNVLDQHFTYKKLIMFTLPSIFMMIFTSIYSIVDGYFISNYVGKTPFAAVNLTMPALNILASLGFMLGTGGAAIVGKLLGEKQNDKANQVFYLIVKFNLLLGIITSVIGTIFMPQISIFLGASEAMLSDCVIYGRIIMAFNFAFMLQFLFQSFFVTAGKPNLGFKVTVVAGLLNMVLDFLFIVVFKWGVAGAAIATVIGQLFGGGYPLYYFSKDNDSLLKFAKGSNDYHYLVNACTNGSSELMGCISGSLVAMLYNFQLIKYSGENGVAAYGVVMYTSMIFQAMFMGYSVGSSALVSYHYGANNTKELNNLLTKSIKLIAITGIAMFGSCFCSSTQLAAMFVGYDQQLMEITKQAFKIYSVMYLLNGFNIYSSSFFTALGNGKISALISFLRSLVFQVSAVLLLPLLLGIEGIWWAVSVAEVGALIVSLICLYSNKDIYHYM